MIPASAAVYAAALERFCAALQRGEAAVAPYRRNYVGGHCAALENTFAATAALLGSEVFGALARVYLQHAPPVGWDLNHYGSGFPALIAAQAEGPRATAFDWPGLGALAAVEYAITCAYYAEDNSEPYICAQAANGSTLSAADALSGHYPFVAIAADLTLTRSVLVQRRGLQLAVTNCATTNRCPER